MDSSGPSPSGVSESAGAAAPGAGGGSRGGQRPRRGPTPEQVRREAARLLETLPPHAIEAEMSVLGAMLLDDRVVGDVIAVLKGPDDFSRPAHGVVYRHMVELYDRENAVDIVKLHQRLVDRGAIEAVGGLEYLVELAQSVPSSSFAVEHARLVRDKAILRALIDAAGAILVDAHGAGLAAKELLQAAEARIFAIAQDSEQANAETLADLLQEALHQLEANEGRHVTGTPSGYYELDEMTSGFQPGELLVLAARPSMGKTALALNLAENIASAGHPVAVFSLEMSRQQLVQRLLCARSGVDGQRLRRGMLSGDDYQRLLAACGELSQSPIFIDDTPGLTLLQLRSKARRLRERMQIEAVIIDYLQLMSVGGRVESRQIEVSEISRGVKAMARELRVPVICLSQLNRAAEQREGHRPRMSDLRESGSIEQDADVVMMLHREDYYHQGDMAWLTANQAKVGVAELIVAKQRNGPTGVVNLRWDSGTTRFLNLSWASSAGDGGSSSRGYQAGGGYHAGSGNGAGANSGSVPGSVSGSASGSGVGPGSVGNGSGRGADASGPDAFRNSHSNFQRGRSSGPVDNFRDGGGPDADFDEPLG